MKGLYFTMKTFALVLMVAWLSGCTVKPVYIALKPQVLPTPINIGRNAKLNLIVIDERAEKNFGYWVDRGYYDQHVVIGNVGRDTSQAIITASEDVAAVLLESLSKGLSGLGFVLVDVSDARAIDLKIVLHNLRNQQSQTNDAITSWVRGAVTATVSRRDTVLYERFYEAERKSSFGIVVVLKSFFEQQMNAVLSDLIERILTDLALLAALSSSSGQTP